MEEFVAYFNIPMALAALIMGVSGGVYTLAGTLCQLLFDQSICNP